MQELHEYVLVGRDELEALKRRADGFGRLEDRLDQLISKEESMAAEQSAEAKALDDAITGLNAELADVSTVDAEVVTDLEGVSAAIGKVNPVSPEQVNAITAATASLTSLTQRLKAAGTSAATAEAGAGEQPAGGGGTATVAAPTLNGVDPHEGPAAGGGTVTISGSNLGGASVAFAGVDATDVQVAEGGASLTCVVPAAPTPGETASVVVTTPGGTASASYVYQAAPAAA